MKSAFAWVVVSCSLGGGQEADRIREAYAYLERATGRWAMPEREIKEADLPNIVRQAGEISFQNRGVKRTIALALSSDYQDRKTAKTLRSCQGYLGTYEVKHGPVFPYVECTFVKGFYQLESNQQPVEMRSFTPFKIALHFQKTSRGDREAMRVTWEEIERRGFGALTMDWWNGVESITFVAK